MVVGPEVMLASSRLLPPDRLIPQLIRDGWFTEVKLDGIRAVVSRPEVGTIRIFNRRQVDVSHRYPDVVAAMQGLDFVGVVDGEIVVADPGGRPAFSLAHLRDAQSSQRGVHAAMAKAPATFVPFDVLTVDGVDVRSEPYTRRREHLVAMFPAGGVSVSSRDAATMWSFVTEHDLEGLVAKRPDAAYRPGRQKSWVKVKATKRLLALVVAVAPGKGSRGWVGALELRLWDAPTGRLVDVGSVGSGLAEVDLRFFETWMEHATPIVVEVEFLEVGSSGKLRMPVFKQVRPVSVELCTTDQVAYIRRQV